MMFCAHCDYPTLLTHMRRVGEPLEADPCLVETHRLACNPMLGAIARYNAEEVLANRAHPVCGLCHGPLQSSDDAMHLLAPVAGTGTPALEAWLRLLPTELERLGPVRFGQTTDPSNGESVSAETLLRDPSPFPRAALPLHVEEQGLFVIHSAARPVRDALMFIDAPTLEAMARPSYMDTWSSVVARTLRRPRRLLVVLVNIPDIEGIDPAMASLSEHEALGRWDRTYAANLETTIQKGLGGTYKGLSPLWRWLGAHVHPRPDLTVLSTEDRTRLLDPVLWVKDT